MSIVSFTKPSDSEILQRFIDNKRINISFVGLGKIHQTNNETFYIRTVKIIKNDHETLQNVIYAKKGISWLFNRTELVQ